MRSSRCWRWGLTLVVVGAVGLVGCSSDGGTSAESPSPPPAAAAPEDQRTTAAAVSEGMRKIDQIAKEIAESAGTDKARAASLAEQIEPAWQPIEGTVKSNDQDAYIAMEDNFAVLDKAAEAGDAAGAAKGAAAISTAVQAYLAKYPE
jgi:hypothetical protein